MRSFILTLSFMLASFASFAQQTVKPLEIDPSAVDPASQQARGPHLVYTTNDSPNGKLLITVGGTGSLPSDFRALHSVALDLGYQVLAIDYPNTVISTSCRESSQADCFDMFRREIVLGAEASSIVDVNTANSILHRITTLIAHLRLKDSRWEAFLKYGQLDWSRVTLAGHSQGSGHAAYLAKLFNVGRVIMIGGPNDSFDPEIAAWTSRPGQTPADRLYLLVHQKDFFRADLQISVFKSLIGGDEGIFSRNAIVSEKPVGDAHMELIQPKFSGEWRKLLSTP